MSVVTAPKDVSAPKKKFTEEDRRAVREGLFRRTFNARTIALLQPIFGSDIKEWAVSASLITMVHQIGIHLALLVKEKQCVVTIAKLIPAKWNLLFTKDKKYDRATLKHYAYGETEKTKDAVLEAALKSYDVFLKTSSALEASINEAERKLRSEMPPYEPGKKPPAPKTFKPTAQHEALFKTLVAELDK